MKSKGGEPMTERIKTDANVFIDRAIEMLKDSYKYGPTVAGYNGIVSLLQYAKESHAAAKPKAEPMNAGGLEQERFNHSMTRMAWDKTCEERDELKNQVKVLSAIKRGLEKSLTEAFEKIKSLSAPAGKDDLADALEEIERLKVKIRDLEDKLEKKTFIPERFREKGPGDEACGY